MKPTIIAYILFVMVLFIGCSLKSIPDCISNGNGTTVAFTSDISIPTNDSSVVVECLNDEGK